MVGRAAWVASSQGPSEVMLGPPPVRRISKSSPACPHHPLVRHLLSRYANILPLCLSDKQILKAPAFQNAPTVPQPHFTKSKERRQRYLRDRIHSLTGSEVKMAVSESTAAAAEVEGDEDDPYAWLSQTAPASPDSERHHRSRDIFR